MIAIKGIKMPACCYSCRFAKFPSGWVFDNISKDPYCTIVFKAVDLSHFERPDWCPLVEVKEKTDE